MCLKDLESYNSCTSGCKVSLGTGGENLEGTHMQHVERGILMRAQLQRLLGERVAYQSGTTPGILATITTTWMRTRFTKNKNIWQKGRFGRNQCICVIVYMISLVFMLRQPKRISVWTKINSLLENGLQSQEHPGGERSQVLSEEMGEQNCMERSPEKFLPCLSTSCPFCQIYTCTHTQNRAD